MYGYGHHSNHQLLQILERTRIDESQASRNWQVMEHFTEALIYAMRKVDPLFNDLFQRKSYIGSYYDGLKVKKADEFDFTLVLDLPFNKQEVEIIRDTPGKLKYRVKGDVRASLERYSSKWHMYKQLVGFFWTDGKLSQDEIRKWIHNVLDKAFDSVHFNKPSSVLRIFDKSKSVAFTYQIETTYGGPIDIDLTPVIYAAKYQMPSGIYRSSYFSGMISEHQELFLVTKPPPNPQDYNADQNFQMDFILAERKLLGTGGCIKNLIKLCKLLRDKQGFDNISSFMIKNFFLLEIDNRSSWPDSNLASLFITMLGRLKSAVEQRQLPYYFDREYNLFKELDSVTATNISRKLNAVIANAERGGTFNYSDFN